MLIGGMDEGRITMHPPTYPPTVPVSLTYVNRSTDSHEVDSLLEFGFWVLDLDATSDTRHSTLDI
jgi:hypothetical protein